MKELPKFTEGPWKAERTKLDGHEWHVRSDMPARKPWEWNSRMRLMIDAIMPEEGYSCPDTFSGRGPDHYNVDPDCIEENKANAQLIAASPLLYMALWAQEIVYDMVREDSFPEPSDDRYLPFIGPWNQADESGARIHDMLKRLNNYGQKPLNKLEENKTNQREL